MAVGAVLAVLAVFAPWLGLNHYWLRQVVVISLLALIVSGLNLSFGYVGELALGQVAVYAAGAYLSGYMALHGITELPVILIVAAAGAVLIGLITGVPGLRLGGWALALTSFFVVLLIPNLVTIFTSVTGGYTGLYGIGQPQLFGVTVGPDGFYVVVVVITLAWMAAFRNLVVSRHGVAFQSLKESPVLASSLGLSVYRTKLVAYAVGAVPAGLAGALFPFLDHLVSPNSFTLDYAIIVVAASVVGGSASVLGALVGAAIFVLGPLRATGFQGGSDIAYGVLLLTGGLLFKGGIADLVVRWRRRLERRLGRTPAAAPASAVGAVDPPATAHPATAQVAARHLGGSTRPRTGRPTLRVEVLSKHFGGVPAVREVSFEAKGGEITALIGANGSGKTTMLNMLSGFYRPDSGQVFLDGRSVSGLPPHQVARAGVARTFQVPAIPHRRTTRQVLESRRYATDFASMWSAVVRGRRFRAARRRDRAESDRVLAMVRLDEWADRQARDLPLGKLRMLELGRAVMSDAQVFLLDEPASGLDEEEIEEMRDVLVEMRAGGAVIVLVEHNFPWVMSLADEVVVLGRGEVIATGVPSDITTSDVVVREYLGQS